MEVKVTELSPVELMLEVTIPVDRVKAEYDEQLAELAKNAQIKGFRKGKTPVKVIRQMYGKKVEAETYSKLVEDTLTEVLREKDLPVLTSPDVALQQVGLDKDMTYSAKVQVRPKIENLQWKGLKGKRAKLEVTETMVEEELNGLRNQHAVLKPIEDRDLVEDGDHITLDVEGFSNGEPLPSGKQENYETVVGEGKLLDEIESQLVGVKVKQEKEFEIDFPKDHQHTGLAGKQISFKVTVHKIQEKELPELDDEFAQDLGEQYESLEDVKKEIRERLEKQHEEQIKSGLHRRIRKELLKQNPITVPPVLIEEQAQTMFQGLKERMGQSGINLDELEGEEEKFMGDYRKQAEQTIGMSLLIDEVAKAENIEVADEDLDSFYEEQAKMYGMPTEQLKMLIEQGGKMDNIKFELREKKTMDLIIEAGDIEEVEVDSSEEIDKLADDDKEEEKEGGEEEAKEETKAAEEKAEAKPKKATAKKKPAAKKPAAKKTAKKQAE